MRWSVLVLILVAGCSTNEEPTSENRSARASVTAPVTSTESLRGEPLFDPAWPSNYREGCLTLSTGSVHTEIITSDEWHMARDVEHGWFEVRDGSGQALFREHHLVTLTGRFVADDGCRETGLVFEVTGVEVPAPVDAVLHVEVVGGIGLVEGSLNMVQIQADDGASLIQAPVGPGEHVEIPSGGVRLVIDQRPCSGNCGMASGSEAPCETGFETKPGEEITITVLLSSEPPMCELLVRDGPPADLVGILELSPYDGADLPYPVNGRCVHVHGNLGSVVPVLPVGWKLTAVGSDPGAPDVVLTDPSGREVAHHGDLVWMNGEKDDDDGAFGCDFGVRFDVTDVVDSRPGAG